MSTQPYQLMQFLNNININNGSVVPKTNYTPIASMQDIYMMDTTVSNFSKKVYSLVSGNNEFTYDYTDTIDGMIPFFNTLVGNLSYRPIYTLFQSIILESFSMVYMIESGYATTLDFTSDDMDRVHYNIQKVIDSLYYVSQEGVYDVIIQLRALDSNLLYMFSTFSGITYTIGNKYDNSQGKINGFIDSEFNDIDTFYVTTDVEGNPIKTSSVFKKIQDNSNNSYLVYYGDRDAVTLKTLPIPVYNNSTFSLRAITGNSMEVLATDKNGKGVDRFVDKDGNIITDSIIAQTIESPKGVQISQGIYVPSGIGYIVVSINMGKSTGKVYDRISNPIIVSGYSIGEYTPGMTNIEE